MTSERQSDHSRQTVARCWGDKAPDWVIALADACDRLGSQNQVAKQLGKSAAMVSNVLANRYGAKTDKAERLVRATFMDAPVRCPGQGGEQLAKAECLRWQERPFKATNPLRVRMYKACRGGCPHSDLEKSDDET